ncbi:MAG: helix-turn-helix domain-containing protein [Chloroflexota bacterium]
MITVPEAAKLAGKDPETIRRWIRTGRLRARKIGTQHVIEERDLEPLLGDEQLPVPKEWQTMPDGRPMPNVVRALRLARQGR